MTVQAFTFFQESWLEGNPGLVGPLTQGLWLGAVVFDGARAFEGVAPDLGHHCRRVIASANALRLKPMVTAGEIEDLAKEGIRKFPTGASLYIRPMFYAENGGVMPDADSTRFCLSVYAQPMRTDVGGAVHLSRFRRPAPDMAPTNAKAACLYPNSGLALREATADSRMP
jgi:branched-chain amino acid aminotransferase